MKPLYTKVYKAFQLKKPKEELKTTLSEEFNNPVITFKKTNGELDIKYSADIKNVQNSKKVLLFRSGYLNPVYDDGINSVGNNIHYCIVESETEGKKLVELYNSNIYKFIFKICKYSAYNNGRVMNWLYNNLSLEEIKNNLSQDEIDIINRFT